MGHVHHPGIKERGIAPLQLSSYRRPCGLDPSSLDSRPFRGNGSQRPLERGVLCKTSVITSIRQQYLDDGVRLIRLHQYRLEISSRRRWPTLCPTHPVAGGWRSTGERIDFAREVG